MAEGPTSTDVTTRAWASVCHLSALALFVPFGNILGPLVVYLMKKDDDPFIAIAGLESLNFQIFISICGFVLLVAYASVFFLVFFSVYQAPFRAHPPMLALIILPVVFSILVLFDFVSVIVAVIRTNRGIAYRYPITLRFVR